MRKFMRIAGIGLAVGALIAALVVYLLIPKTSVVYFDNGLAFPVIIKVDGKFFNHVLAHQLLRTDTLSPGRHNLEFIAREDPELQSLKVLEIPKNAVKLQRRWVYNLRHANRHAIYKLGYGDSEITKPKLSPLQERTFFEITTQYDLGKGFPDTIKVSKKVNSTTLTVLGHYPLHATYDCCKALRHSLDHLPEYHFGDGPVRKRRMPVVKHPLAAAPAVMQEHHH